MTAGTEADPAEQAPSGRAPIRKALSLSALNTVIGKLGTFLTGVVLARLLTPEDFGVYAVALVALTAVLALNELGVSLALVRWPGDPMRIAPTVTTISLVSSGLMYLACFFGAPLFASALEAPEATGVIRLLCVLVLIDGLTATPEQLVNRQFRQGVRLLVDLANLVITTGVTVGLAAAGHGPWSLAWGQLVGNVLSALVLFRLAGVWPRPGFDRRYALQLLRFGLPLAGASLLVFGMLNIDYVVTGRVLGAAALGLYLQAFNLASWPVNVFSLVVRRVSLAAFARVQEDPAQRQATLGRMAMLLAVPTLPACVVLGLLALPLVTTVYGQPWAGSAAALQFLAILAAVRVFGELYYDFLVALGKSRTTMWLQGGWLLALGAALPVGALLGGIQGVALAHAGVALLLVLPVYTLVVTRTGISVRVLAVSIARPASGALAVAAVLVVLRFLLEPSWVLLVAGLGLSALVYLPFVWPLRKKLREFG
ncbi:lipopolysaccharide biosynthesis protein [Amycolatopsis cihanbeyliensis]|uniref:PST family polysaccharide transporter n=1 Tax=Amycolatopsis cihanbeyliensis TaxID=1128664 RepID=A0A542DFH9_AMYCI|nr:lipopolysaccharide biosynthesis protein [Amycolatopsis cihanbeyliensis]TQJ01835.1 PST family polysaccharide transporter [Amycolatopsis cihanbeyliensis]